MASKQQKQQDLGQRLEQLKVLQTQLSQQIEELRSSGEVAPTSAWIVRYLARGKGGSYWYYKWQSPEPIFITQKGQKSRYKYIGKAGSPAFLKAVEVVARRSLSRRIATVPSYSGTGIVRFGGRSDQNGREIKPKVSCPVGRQAGSKKPAPWL